MSDDRDALQILDQDISAIINLFGDKPAFVPDIPSEYLDYAIALGLDHKDCDYEKAQEAFQYAILGIQLQVLNDYKNYIHNSNGEGERIREHIIKKGRLQASAPVIPGFPGGLDLQSNMNYFQNVAAALVLSPDMHIFRMNLAEAGVSLTIDQLYDLLINTVGEEADFYPANPPQDLAFVSVLSDMLFQNWNGQSAKVLQDIGKYLKVIVEKLTRITAESHDANKQMDFLVNIVNRIFNRLMLTQFHIMKQSSQ